MRNGRIILGIGILLFFMALCSRFIDLPWNFNPLIAIALFGSFLFEDKRWRWTLPLVAYFVSDLILNNTVYREYFDQQGFVIWQNHMWWTYGSMVLIVALGSVVIRRITVSSLIGAAIGSSILFFLVTNFGTWIGTSLYSNDVQGLVKCYTMALPFFRSTLLGSVLFTVIIFGLYALSGIWLKGPVLVRK